jgi:curved DNA-binding protein CbpA
MDPYRILGVKRGCTPDEAKAAFRSRAWTTHPDRGGDEQAFVEFCAAYKAVLREARSGGEGQNSKIRSARAGRSKVHPHRDLKRNEPPQTSDQLHDPITSTDAIWQADLILPANVGRDGKPAPAPDPQWQPELVVPDETRADQRPPDPTDPNWRPAVVFLDDSSPAERGKAARKRGSGSEGYSSLLKRLASDSSEPGSSKDLIRALGIILFVALLIGNIWFCWAAFSYDPEKAERQAAKGQTTLW